MEASERRIYQRRRAEAFRIRPQLPSGLSLSALKPSLDDYDAYESSEQD